MVRPSITFCQCQIKVDNAIFLDQYCKTVFAILNSCKMEFLGKCLLRPNQNICICPFYHKQLLFVGAAVDTKVGCGHCSHGAL